MSARGPGILMLSVAFCLGSGDWEFGNAQSSGALPGGSRMTHRAAGTFDVKLTPAGNEEAADGNTLGRMTIEKQYHGDLQGQAQGDMLTGMSAVKNSGVYVAIERISGALNGRRGTFLLHHRGVMTRGAQDLIISVVPDSGTGELKGLDGRLQIAIDDGTHSYVFEYDLPD